MNETERMMRQMPEWRRGYDAGFHDNNVVLGITSFLLGVMLSSMAWGLWTLS